MGTVYSSGRIAKAICGRCSFKKDYQELSPDPNVPGLRVCCDCKDQLDPYRLPPRQPDAFVLRHPRPDTPLIPPPYVVPEVWPIDDMSGYVAEDGETQYVTEDGGAVYIPEEPTPPAEEGYTTEDGLYQYVDESGNAIYIPSYDPSQYTDENGNLLTTEDGSSDYVSEI